VAKPVSHDDLPLTFFQRQLLTAVHPDGTARFWAAKARGIGHLEIGDQVWFFAKNEVYAIATVMTVALQDQGAAIIRALWPDYDSTERAVVFTVSEPMRARISMSDIEALVAQRHTYRWLNGALLDEQDSAVLLGRNAGA
jgi:hypothetical protein